MNKKLMLLAAGALTALAFAALPALASGAEFSAECTGAATCTGTVVGNTNAELEDSTGLRITCTGTSGTTTMSGTSTTLTFSLTFTGCKESIFSTQCNSTGTSGEIKTGNLTGHLVYIEPNKGTPGVLVTGVNVTINCPVVFTKKTVTGNVIGKFETPECGKAKTSHKVVFEASATTGTQTPIQVTTTGPFFDLTSNNHAGGNYLTSTQVGTGTITYGAGTDVKLEC